MTDRSDISDETLTAYLDDELSAPERAMVEQSLECDDTLQARLMALDVPSTTLRASADAVLAHAPPCPDLPLQQTPPPRALGLVGLVAACAIGVFAGLNWASTKDQDWVTAVANYQSLYVTETLERSEAPELRAGTLSTLSEAIELDLVPLLEITDIAYRRAQLLGFEGRPLVQVAYLDGDVPIAICITLRDGDDRNLQQGEHFGLASASWQKDGHGFLVIGGTDPALIKQVADQVRSSI